jgi:ornithine carbamoyltransferase
MQTTAVAHFCNDLDLDPEALVRVLDLAAKVKRAPGDYAQALVGQNLALLFEKPSLRTVVAFELAMKQLGGGAVVSNGTMGQREPVKDIARLLGRWTQGIAARVYSQWTVDELARWAGIPVINALSDVYHPCQALADVLTIKEHFGNWDGLKVAYVGDGNNVLHSLMLTATRLGMTVYVASPKGYEPDRELVALARRSGLVELTYDPREAVEGAHVVYTDVWASMGQEDEIEQRAVIFKGFGVTESMMANAHPEAIFMHCLPAHRGDEVTEGVLESKQSAVWDQAENRLHTQKAVLLTLLGKGLF